MIKKNEIQKLRQKSIPELEKDLNQLKAEMPKIHNELKLGKLTNSKAPRKTRYQIALINTILREKALANQLEK